MPALATHPLVRSFLRDAKWAPTTVGVAVSVLNRWCAWLDQRGIKLTDASRDDAETYLEECETRGLAPASVHSHYRMMRAIHTWLAAEGEADRNPITFKPPKVPETPVKVLAETEYRRLVATCDRRTELGRRDEAMLSLLWWSGLRRHEIVGLNLADIDLDRAVVQIGSRTFTTKTKKIRRAPLAGETVAAIDRYLRRRGYEPGPLFLSQHGDEHADRRLRPNSIQLILRRRAKVAGLRTVGAHEFRRAMAVRHKRAGGSETGLMAIAGWSTPAMINLYTRMEREELAAEEFHRLVDTSVTSARRRGRRVS